MRGAYFSGASVGFYVSRLKIKLNIENVLVSESIFRTVSTANG